MISRRWTTTTSGGAAHAALRLDEATAILAGDGLQAAAFQRLTEIEALSAEQRLDMIGVVSKAVGFHGMVGGRHSIWLPNIKPSLLTH